ncbi:condensation domain-containing protein [Streptomyces barringtoniae]|uniref:condensation domain-containing protein n=1 Tax=Streptomyces barringtoniae TaxID=2892029 RepID=UPI001E4E27A0|nr:condensation domain-containing protein [Streptomyces barringtoniae]MCC5478305.1 condensation domain-containing protein [Streptomyces barringtoniae]
MLTWVPTKQGKRPSRPSEGIVDFCRQPFESLEDPLVRVWWWPVDEWHSELLVIAHHLVMDGYSGPELIDELAAAHFAAVGDTAVPDAASEGDLYAYAARSNQDARRSERDLADDFWVKALEDLPYEPLLARSTAVPASGDGLVIRSIDVTTASSLRRVARTRRAGLPTLFGAALAGQLAEDRGRTEVTIGIAVDHRPPEYAHTVGMFVDVLPLRVQVPDPSPSTADNLLSQVREGLLDLLDHASTPSARIFRMLRLRKPIEVSLSVRSSWNTSRAVGNSTWSVEELRLPESPYPCTVDVTQEPDGTITIAIYYQGQHLHAEEACALADGLVNRLLVCADAETGTVR